MENDRNTLKTMYSISSAASIRPRWSSSAAKRLVDVLAAALGLLILSPVPSPRPVICLRGLQVTAPATNAEQAGRAQDKPLSPVPAHQARFARPGLLPRPADALC